MFERYDRIWKSDTECEVNDLGSELPAEVGPYEIEWSYGEVDANGWLYVHTDIIEVTVLPDADFATRSLKERAEPLLPR